MKLMSQDQKYWAKYCKEDGSYHLVRYHQLDVAAFFENLLEQHPKTKEKILRPFPKKDREEALRFIIFQAALHDLGKFGAFQGMIPELCKEFGLPSYGPEKYHHSTAGYMYWYEKLADQFFGNKRELQISALYLQPIYAHHGYPPFASWKDEAKGAYTHECLEAFNDKEVAAFVKDVHDLFGNPSFPLKNVDIDQMYYSAWILAGAMIFSDWMGSTNKYFEFEQKPKCLREYYNDAALPQARFALKDLNFCPQNIEVGSSFKDLYPQHTARPSQEVINTLEFSGGGQLLIIEDATGSGKTEAALLAARKMIMEGAAEGIYFALPTQISATEMLKRVGKLCTQFFGKNSPALTSFASGSANICNYYDQLKNGIEDGAMTHDWLKKKSALLSQMGAGTVDQALMSVLTKNHSALRLYGMSRNVIIIDEVHAYQTYQMVLVKRLLEYCSKMDIPVILLSATLPQNTREELVHAYGNKNIKVDKKAGYPLITYLDTTKGK